MMKPKPNIQKEIEELSPFLADLRKEKEGFEVPKNYFNGLTNSIMAECQTEKQQNLVPQLGWLERLSVFLNSWVTPRYAVGFASVVLLIFAGFFLFNPNSPSDSMYADLSTQEIEAYVYANIEDFDLDLLAEDLSSPPDNSAYFNDISSEDLEQYIEDNVLDDVDETTLENIF